MAINNNALASSQATVLSEDGNTLYATIQMRHGKEADMDKSKFVPAEIGVCTDTKKAVVAFAPNDIKEIAFKGDLDYNDLENKPSIGGVELDGDKTLKQLGIQPEGDYLTEVPDGYVTEEQLEEQLADRLDKNQGAGNAGKMLVVGDDGNVQVGDEPIKVDPTLTQPGQAGDALETGHQIDRKAPAIVQDAFGYGGVITDSAEASLQGLKVYGASRQFTTTGANLLPNDVFHSTSDDINATLTEDGGIHLSGTTTKNDIDLYFIGNSIGTDDAWEEFPAGTYTIICNSISDNDNVSFCFVIKNRSGSNDNIINVSNINTAKTINVVEGDKIRVFLRIKNAGTSLDGYFYPMLNAGSEALPFEPYTGGLPAPNPDYPQDVEIPGSDGSVSVDVFGKNLAPITKNSVKSQNGLTAVLNEDGSITVNGTPTVVWATVFNETISLMPGTYYISGGDGSSSSMKVEVTILRADGTTEYFSNKKVNLYDDDQKVVVKVVNNVGSISNLQPVDTTVYPMLVKGSTAPEAFEPYKPKQTLTLQTPNGLSGIPVTSGGNYTDSDGQQWVCDEIDLEHGKYVQRITKVIFDGSSDEVWKLNQVNSYGIANFSIYKPLSATAIISDRFIRQSSLIANTTTEGIMAFSITTIYIRIKQERASDVDSFRSWLSENPVTVLYTLINPIETDLTQEEIAAYKALRANYPTTTVMTDTDPQVTLDMQYAVDTKTYIDNKIAEYVQSAISNSLLSTNTAQALSAPMGAELNSKIEALEQKLESEEE